jgi:hypothetical protein
MSVETPAGTVIYRANEYYRGRKWYDWALMQDPIRPQFTYIGNIVGFVRYTTRGFPTYKLIEMDGLQPEEIEVDNTRDDTLYVVFRASKECFSEEQLEGRMTTPFEIQGSDQGYIYPVTCIKKPLLVVRDIGSCNARKYLHCMPQHRWGTIFRNLIREKMEEREKEGKVRYGCSD